MNPKPSPAHAGTPLRLSPPLPPPPPPPPPASSACAHRPARDRLGSSDRPPARSCPWDCTAHASPPPSPPPPPQTGEVVGWASLDGLRQIMLKAAAQDPGGGRPHADVLNGIAWDRERRRLFVTGKFWARLYELALAPQQPANATGAGAEQQLKAMRQRCIVADTRGFG